MPAGSSSAAVSVELVGAKATTGVSTLWIVNGTTQQNQTEFSFSNGSNDAFTAEKTTTVTIESVTSIYLEDLDLIFVNAENTAGCKISYQAVIDGKTVNNDQNITITSTNSYDHDYQYGSN